MSKLHEESAPDSQYISKEEVPILTIDTVFKKHNFNYSNLFLKLDVQGYEEQVLNGAVQNISKFKGVICELSLAHLYDNTISWIDLVKKIEELGFNLWSIYPGFTDSKNGRMLQIDALFIRNGN
jgi:hypothetical protein